MVSNGCQLFVVLVVTAKLQAVVTINSKNQIEIMLPADSRPCQTSVMEDLEKNVYNFFHGTVEWNTVLLRISATALIQFVKLLVQFWRLFDSSAYS